MSIISSAPSENTQPQLSTLTTQSSNTPDPELFSSLYLETLQEIIQRSKLPTQECHIEYGSVVTTSSYRSQIGRLKMGSIMLVFHSLIASFDTKDEVNAFTQRAVQLLNDAKLEQPNTFAFFCFKNVRLSSVLQMSGLKLMQLDKQSTRTSCTAIIVESGMMINVANALGEAAAHGSDQKHSDRFFANEFEAFKWGLDCVSSNLGFSK